MNDSPYGLTASVWTNVEKNAESEDAFLRIVDEVETGTVFLNRCVVVGSGLMVMVMMIFPLGVIIWTQRWRGRGLRIVGGVLA